VDKVIEKLRNRIWQVKALGRLSLILLVSSLALLLLAAARHVIVIPHPAGKAGVLLAALWLPGCVLVLAGRPGIREAALAGDRLGLKNRLCTHLEYGDRGGAVLEAFKEELEDALAHFSPALLYPLRFPWKRVLAAVIATAAAGSFFWLPSPAAREADLREAVNRELKQEAKNVALMKEALAEETVPEDDGGLKNKAVPLLEELEKKLERDSGYREAALQVGDTVRQLRRLGPAAGDIKGLAGVFAGAGEKTAAAAALLRSGDAGGAARALENISLNPGERRAMLENADRLLQGGELTETGGNILQELKKSLAKQELSAGELGEALNPLPQVTKEAAELEKTEKKLDSMKERLLAGSGGFDNPGEEGNSQIARQGEAALKTGEAAGASITGQTAQGGVPRGDPGALGGGLPGGG
jgi:hypothetical protein